MWNVLCFFIVGNPPVKEIFNSSTAKLYKPLVFNCQMLDKYLRPGVTKPRILKLLTVIGELKSVHFSSLKTVKNSVTDKVATKKLIDSFLTDSLLELTEFDNLKLTVKSLDLLRSHKINVKHIIKDPIDGNSEHRTAIIEFLLPIMFEDNYHAVGYGDLYFHELTPDAILILKHPEGYQIKFIEVEHTNKGIPYLLQKRDKYIALGEDINTWDGWWRKKAEKFGLPFCTKEEFKFSVLCKGNKTFEWEGWEWSE